MWGQGGPWVAQPALGLQSQALGSHEVAQERRMPLPALGAAGWTVPLTGGLVSSPPWADLGGQAGESR